MEAQASLDAFRASAGLGRGVSYVSLGLWGPLWCVGVYEAAGPGVFALLF